MEPETGAGDFHSKILDPVADEIIRIFKILQNDDGSWSTYENKLDRAFSTSWALQAICNREERESETKALSFFKDILEDIDYDVKRNFQKISRERFLKGFFNIADIMMKSKQFNKNKLKKVYTDLLKILDEKNWLSSTSIATYIVFGLRNQNFVIRYVERAKAFIEKEIGFQRKNFSSMTPDICLALPDTLRDFLETPEEFITQVKSLSDLKIAHVLIALSLLNEQENKIIINGVRSCLLERLRKRQITEIDRKITKQFLDLTLLLRSGQKGMSLKNRLKDFSPLITIESLSSDNISLKVKLTKLTRDFGILNIITLASYVFALRLLNEENIYLLSSNQYKSIKEFFIHDTIPISKRRELGFEIVTFMFIGALFILSLFGISYGVAGLTKISKSMAILKGNEWDTALFITPVIFGAIIWKGGLIKCFPTLGNIVNKYILRGR